MNIFVNPSARTVLLHKVNFKKSLVGYGGCLLINVASTICVGSLLESKRCKRRGQKNIPKESNKKKM